MAVWSKALVLGTSLSGGVGSNPTAAKFHFCIIRTLVVYGSILWQVKATKVFLGDSFEIKVIDECF